jgi:two-component system, NarL family, invasion response regulator UvrY
MKPESKEGIRVLLADESIYSLEGAAAVLEPTEIEIVGQVRCPDEAMRRYAELRPDILMFDIKFRENFAGLQCARELLKRTPDAKIVFFSDVCSSTLIVDSYRSGGLAFIPKTSGVDVITDALRVANRGQLFFLPAIAQQLARFAVEGDDSPKAKLDARELEVFLLMAIGKTIAEIAATLNLSTKTIANTSVTVKTKLGVQREAHITLLALRHGLIEP